MRWVRRFLPLLAVTCFCLLPARTEAVSSATYVGRGWTLVLAYQQTAAGEMMFGTFRSARQSFRVSGDWIPAADAGSNLLRFYGHPFGLKNITGLVGVATLGNTCVPSCVASRQYLLREIPNVTTLPNTLPGIGTAGVVLRLLR